MKRFLSVTLIFSKYMDWVAGIVLVLMMLLTSLDVILRYLGKPIIGTYDLVTLGAAFVFGFALPKTSWDKIHVTVDVLVIFMVDRHPRIKDIFDIFNKVIALLFFVLLGWNFAKLGMTYSKVGEGTLTLAVPLYPIAYLLGLCCVVQCLVLVADIVKGAYQEGSHV